MAQRNKTHEQRIKRLEELVATGMDVKLAMEVVGLEESEVRKVLCIDDDVELTNASILVGLVRFAASAERSRATHGAGIHRAHEGLKAHATRLNDVEKTVEEIVEHLGMHGVRAVGSDVVQGMSLRSALMARGLTEAEIRIMLRLRDEQGMTDADFIMVFVNRISLVEQRVEHLEVIVGHDGENLITRENVTEVVTMTIEERSRFPWVALIAAAVVGLIAGLLWDAHDFGNGSTVVVPGGTRSLNAWADGWAAAWLFGIAVGAIVFGILSLMVSSTTRSEQTTVATDEDEEQPSNRRSWNPFRGAQQRSREQNAPNARLLSSDDEHTEDDTVVEYHGDVPQSPSDRAVGTHQA